MHRHVIPDRLRTSGVFPASAAVCGSLALGLFPTACGNAPGLQPSDAGEQVVHVYNWADYIGRRTIAEFEAATGIRVVYDTYDSEGTMEAVLLAGGSGYDVVGASTDTFSREIKAGVYQPLEKSKLPNWKNLDTRTLARQNSADPSNRYAIPYLHAINGFSYNVDMIRARMPDAPVGSLDMLFKPEVIAHFKDCGVTFLDSAADMLQLALRYLHLDPNTSRREDLEKAAELLLKVRPYIRNFDSSEYMNALANKEVCIAASWSSDYAASRARARAAGIIVNLAFTVPSEGANVTFTGLLIPADAPHPQAAHRFLNFLMEPRVIAEISNETHYGNDNAASRAFVDPELLNDPSIYPTPQIEARLYESKEISTQTERIRTRVWTRIKTGI
jgi:putrescine transport system substrate-binding protein